MLDVEEQIFQEAFKIPWKISHPGVYISLSLVNILAGENKAGEKQNSLQAGWFRMLLIPEVKTFLSDSLVWFLL